MAEMKAGKELDKLVGQAFGFEPRVTWEILNAAETATAIGFDRRHEAEAWLADQLRRMPDSWLKDYHVGAWEHWPRFSTDRAAALDLVDKLTAQDFWPSMTWKSGVIPGDFDRAVWFVRFRCVRGGTRGDHWHGDESFALAVCLAARKVIEATAHASASDPTPSAKTAAGETEVSCE